MANDLNITALSLSDRPADYAETFAAGAGAVDLTARAADMPQHAPQIVEAYNEAASTQNAVVTTIRGKTLTVPVPSKQRYAFQTPVAALSGSSGADVSFVAYWWKVPGHKNSSP